MDTTSRPRVKNKAAAPVQITAEQLLREAVSHSETKPKAPTTRFADLEELHEYQGRKRQEFEKYVRQNPDNINNFTRYASWELEQREYDRARSVFERGLDRHPTDVKLWMRYIDAELKEKNINHSRNLLDRAVTILPRVDKLWFKYVYTEETLQDVERTREIFERWMSWEPESTAWNQFIKFELRYGEVDNARAIFERYVIVHPEPATWIKFAKFEMENGTMDLVRAVFEQACDVLGDEFMSEKVIIEFARFETKLEEYERARSIYKYALDRLPRSKSQNIHKAYTEFEKQFGDTTGIENVVLAKRRVQYEDELRQNPKNYDTWFDLARLEDSAGDVDRVREVYERAITQTPPLEKKYWRRYIFLFLFYATFEEAIAGDIKRAEQVYEQALKHIPHNHFTFAKIWLQKARFYVRQMDITAARKTLGHGLGLCPKNKLFKEYIALEKKLYEFQRCRILYEKWLAFDPNNTAAWKDFAELERGLADIPRARAIYDIATGPDLNLDMPEIIWKDYIDFETEEEEFERARALYEKLLQRTDHVKVWISYAQFEINISEEGDEENEDEAVVPEDAKQRARAIFKRANDLYKQKGEKEYRVALLQAWNSFEATHGNEEEQQRVEKMMPKQVKKRRRIDEDNFEESVDWIFPADDEGAGKLASLLAKANAWKKQQEAAKKVESSATAAVDANGNDDDGEEDDDDMAKLEVLGKSVRNGEDRDEDDE